MRCINLILLLFFALIILPFSIATISVYPSSVSIGESISINVNFQRYDKDIYFYKEGSNEISHILDLGCGNNCSGGNNYSYLFSDVLFSPGNYVLKLYSKEDEKWFYANFNIKCSDGTNVNSCSFLKPFYCKKDIGLIENCLLCGCLSSDYQCDKNGSCVLNRCSDGTFINECSLIRPLRCDSSLNLIENCSLCGCLSSNYQCEKNGSCVLKKCSDGTLINECSLIRPLRCDSSLNLTEDCLLCGCLSSDYQCERNGSCVLKKCSDGTLINECSLIRPLRCDSSLNLTEDCSLCGCPQRYECSGDKKCILNRCSDGTLINECSLTRPLQCDSSLNLIEDCSLCGCPEGYECSENKKCLSYSEKYNVTNKKDSSKFSNKEVFIISDQDWEKVLPFISLAIWSENKEVNKHPFLIFHRERDFVPGGDDIDSIVYFLQEYNPDKITLIEEYNYIYNSSYYWHSDVADYLVASSPVGIGINEKNINFIEEQDYFKYWKTYRDVVYVQRDYELALIASTYASLINAPMVIQGSDNDNFENLKHRNIICVGDVKPTSGIYCDEKYNLKEIRQKYKVLTNTDKIVYVNPTDWDLSVDVTRAIQLKRGGYIKDLYAKTSLSAPIIASSKQQLLLSNSNTRFEDIDNFLSDEILGMRYLTIVASPNVVPHTAHDWRGDVKRYGFVEQFDTAFDILYAGVGSKKLPDVAVGRIAGLSSSDVSSNIARSVFYSELKKTNNVKFIASAFDKSIHVLENMVKGMSYVFSNSGYNSKSVTSPEVAHEFDPKEWENQDLIFYTDHGATNWAGIEYREIPLLKNSFIEAATCLTVSTFDYDSFWAWAIRQGAVGYIGATSVTGLNSNYVDIANKIYYYNVSMGEALKSSYDSSLINDINPFIKMTILIGDPTLNLGIPEKLHEKLRAVAVACSGDFCLTNSFCCAGTQCDWFTCKDCKQNGNACLLNNDCCLDLQCDWFTCRDCKQNGGSCLVNGDCCGDLQCNWFVCKDCKQDGKACLLSDDCCSASGCHMFSCGLRKRGEVCILNTDCDGTLRCNWFYCDNGKPYDSQCFFNNECNSGNCKLVKTGKWLWNWGLRCR